MIIEKRLAEIEALALEEGSHQSLEEGLCFMEAVSYVAGEKWSDHPACACPVISAFMRRWNDDLGDAGRQRLKPYVAKLVGTKSTKSKEGARAWMATDWMIRQHVPAWLDLAGCHEQANALRALPEITAKSIGAAESSIASARAAARSAAGDAARSAARSAAVAAAGAAAKHKLEPTKVSLQASAFDLLDRMIAS